jgi:hypothetical protein
VADVQGAGEFVDGGGADLEPVFGVAVALVAAVRRGGDAKGAALPVGGFHLDGNAVRQGVEHAQRRIVDAVAEKVEGADGPRLGKRQREVVVRRLGPLGPDFARVAVRQHRVEQLVGGGVDGKRAGRD